MSVAELKEKLIHQIEKSEDISLLEDIGRMIEIEHNSEKIFKLNSGQISAIAEARNQIALNKYLNGTEADKQIDEWFKK